MSSRQSYLRPMGPFELEKLALGDQLWIATQMKAQPKKRKRPVAYTHENKGKQYLNARRK